MAFPDPVAVVTSVSAAGTSHIVDLPPADDGEILGILYSSGNASGTERIPAPPDGWEMPVHNLSNGHLTAFLWKVADGSEGGSVEITSGNSHVSVHVAVRITGGTGAPVISSVNVSTDPPSLTPPWGSAQTLWMALCTARGDTGLTPQITGAPSSYSGLVAIDNGGTGNASAAAAVAFRELAAASEDPGAFTVTGQVVAKAITIAIEPEVVAVDIDVPLSETVTESLPPAVAGGVLVAAPLSETVSESFPPAVAGGASVAAPLSETVSESFPPEIETGGASVSVPLSETVSESLPPEVVTGAFIFVPLAETVSESLPPTVVTGLVEIDVPLSETVSESLPPAVAGGASVAVPLSETMSQSFPPQVFVVDLDWLLGHGEIVERSMILFDFPSGLWGFWTGLGPLLWNGVTFNGAGSLIEVEPFEAVSDLSSVPLVARLRAIPESEITPDVLATIEEETYHQRPVTIYSAYFDPATRALISVVAKYRGYVDQIEHEQREDGAYALAAHIESRARDHTKTGYRLRSDRDQQLIWPGDTGLRHAGLAASQPVYWGRATPSKIRKS